eukprot:CAMPEP_0174697036 /NCGR_PEP_ID=MMETSP1094-20130205/3012_1 /TAXON_ID=156173 /ORGANISM="Chrysochromulina brevifilum, Strain UTEX LB 985" /LENGTH=88 /DNA_ID=CAMNT_0015893935 /DNA_START=594 /DNA_END=859 /DNA_ORIENTATION=-
MKAKRRAVVSKVSFTQREVAAHARGKESTKPTAGDEGGCEPDLAETSALGDGEDGAIDEHSRCPRMQDRAVHHCGAHDKSTIAPANGV